MANTGSWNTQNRTRNNQSQDFRPYHKANPNSKPRPESIIPEETKILEDGYVQWAKKVIVQVNPAKSKLTMTQIRNLLSLTSQLYDDSRSRTYEQMADDIAYLRIQFVYRAGKEAAVKNFVKQARILDTLQYVEENKDIKVLRKFCRYMEALVAYFKFEGGREK